jgi:hypothetical protein
MTDATVEHVWDKGPWSVQKGSDGRYGVASDDFRHDVWLHVNGDFGDDDQRKQYCEWLAAKLNAETGDVRVRAAAVDLLSACKAQHQAIDILFAMLIRETAERTSFIEAKLFFPSKSGLPWDAMIEGNAAIAKAEGRVAVPPQKSGNT